jgi:hypothetical protein
MADDLVAELTLRLINETNAGVSEIRGELETVADSATQTADVLSELTESLQAMNVPAGLAEGFAGVSGEAEAAITSIDGIGAAIDTDIVKVKALQDAMADLRVPAAIDGGGGAGGGEPPTIIPGNASSPDDSEDPRQKKSGGSVDVPGENWIMDLIAIAAGYHGEESYSKFQETALQTAIIEGYHGKGALTEAKNIMHESYNQAYLSRGNADDIEEAYFNLIRQGLPKQLVDQMMGPLTEAATTYGTPVADITQPLFNLAEQFKIPGDQLAQGVAMLGAASHLGHFYFSDFGTGLPEVAAQFQLMGATGFAGEGTAASALEVIRRVTPDSGTAGTDLYDLMNYMTSPMATRFFDRTQRSKDLLGKPVLDLLAKYHVQPLDIPQYLNTEEEKGIDPLDAMVDYMHSIWRPNMTPTDERFIFGSLFHNQQAATAMTGLVENYDLFHQDQASLARVSPVFLDQNFQTAAQGDASGMQNLSTLVTYLERLYGQNTWGLFAGNSGAPTQANANAVAPGSSAFNVPINIIVNVDKSGNVTSTATAGAPGAPPPGVSVRVNQGRVLGAQ